MKKSKKKIDLVRCGYCEELVEKTDYDHCCYETKNNTQKALERFEKKFELLWDKYNWKNDSAVVMRKMMMKFHKRELKKARFQTALDIQAIIDNRIPPSEQYDLLMQEIEKLKKGER